VSLLKRLTTNPPVGAAPEIVTVAIDVAGYITVDGLSVRFESVGGFSVSVALWVPPPVYVAEMCAVAVAATVVLVTVNVVELKPAGTVTELTDKLATAVLSLATLTTTPPVGAVVFNVTVAVEVAPPITLAGLNPTDEMAGGFIVRITVRCTPLKDAEIVLVVWRATLAVFTVKVADMALAATVTLGGTVADVEVLPSVTNTPPVWAGPLSVTVPVGFVEPPCTIVALNPSEVTPVAAGATVSVALRLPPPVNVAEIPEVAVELNPLILVTVNVPVLLPDTTVAVAGTVAVAVLLLARLTTTPPVGAVAFKVIVPVEVDAVPLGSLVMVVGFRVTDETAGGFTVSGAVCCTPS
jgi:hypothetical protein